MAKKQTLHQDVPCPFCGLLCDDLVIDAGDNPLKIVKNGCAKAKFYFEQPVQNKKPKINGKEVPLSDAIDAASKILAKSKMPLFSGLGTDVNGMRSVLKLADKLGAILRHMHNDGILRNNKTLQETGWIGATLAEVKNRSDLIIFVGTDTSNYPRFFERVVWNKQSLFRPKNKKRKIIYIGNNLDTKPGRNPDGKTPQVIKCKPDNIIELVRAINALINDQPLDDKQIRKPHTIASLKKVVAEMKRARYGVIVWAASELQFPYAELTIQSISEVLRSMTRFTRFVGFPLSGSDGAVTANNVCAWQTGYPLPVNFSKGYPEYDAYRHATQETLDHQKFDALLWISSFSSNIAPPKTDKPTIVLARPELKMRFKPDVFIPIATPGVEHTGQHFRTDSVISLAIKKLRDSQYPNVSHVLKQIMEKT